MGIEAYLDVEEQVEDKELEELSPEAYKGLVQQINIDKAEQSIIEEVVGVDGDDDEDEREELREEREMKNLFEQLYEVDPDTKEVFVKGSAYDLKKWDEDMVCFTFGDPERVIALEAAISPGERYLSKCFDRLNTKHTELANVMRRHSNALRAKTISKAFAQDFKQVMGYPLPNIHMESFTTMPSSTNYSIAMEEMSNQQIALAAGASLAGIAVVYKLVQWFAKALNKNSLATGSISKNFQAFSERRETLRNMPADLAKAKENMNVALAEVKQSFGDNNNPNINKLLNRLKTSANASSQDQMFDAAMIGHLNVALDGKLTPFMEAVFANRVKDDWWNKLANCVDDAKQAQTHILTQMEAFETRYNTEQINADKADPKVDALCKRLRELDLDVISGIKGSTIPEGGEWESMAEWLRAKSSSLFTAYTDPREIQIADGTLQSLGQINLEVFEKLDSNYVSEMTAVAKRFKDHADKATKEGKEATKENNVIKGNRAQTLMRMSKEFQFVSNVIRMVILIRNQLGVISKNVLDASGKTESWMNRLFK